MTLNRFTKFFQQFSKSFLTDEDHLELISIEKDKIRKEIKERKKELTEEEKQLAAQAIFSIIESRPEFIKAKTLLLYWSMPDEVPTHEFIKKWSASKLILLPVVKGHHMTIRPFVGEDGLSKGDWNVMEPTSSHDYLKMINLVIVPGVAFDRKKRRLGRGKGYYDKYFKSKRLEKWGLCFDFQLYNTIPTASFDVMMDVVFTPSELIE